MIESNAKDSPQQIIDRFNTPQAASKYAVALNESSTHRREVRCLRQALRDVPPGASVLDLPCGTGRLLPELMAMGFQVTCADSSPHMVEEARKYAKQCGLQMPEGSFVAANAFETGFPDQAFDAVVCNRLFHHFGKAEDRQRALREFVRISRGPIVISFFCTRSIDAVAFHAKQMFRRKKATDRIPISTAVLARDVRASGVKVRRWLATRPGISKQWYVVVTRR